MELKFYAGALLDKEELPTLIRIMATDTMQDIQILSLKEHENKELVTFCQIVLCAHTPQRLFQLGYLLGHARGLSI